jgi:hypothetical protein
LAARIWSLVALRFGNCRGRVADHLLGCRQLTHQRGDRCFGLDLGRAAIAFLAAATNTDQDRVAHLVILVIASLPDLLAVMLLVAAGYSSHQTTTVSAPVVVPAPVEAPGQRE